MNEVTIVNMSVFSQNFENDKAVVGREYELLPQNQKISQQHNRATQPRLSVYLTRSVHSKP